jgi:hypothetical protein
MARNIKGFIEQQSWVAQKGNTQTTNNKDGMMMILSSWIFSSSRILNEATVSR